MQWIKTQELLFGQPYNFERLVEFGPSPTLVGMAQRTHKAYYKAADEARGKRREMLCISKDKEALYYSFADAEPEEAAAPAADAPAATPAASAPAPASAAAPAPTSAPAGGAAAAAIPDEPLKATTRKVPPTLEGIRIDDRYGVIFSPYDMSCALENHESLECLGYVRKDAARIGLNVLLYALHQ